MTCCLRKADHLEGEKRKNYETPIDTKFVSWEYEGMAKAKTKAKTKTKRKLAAHMVPQRIENPKLSEKERNQIIAFLIDQLGDLGEQVEGFSRAKKASLKRRVEEMALFLFHLSECGVVQYAAIQAGVGYRTVYNWIEKYPVFADAYEKTLKVGMMLLEGAVLERAFYKSDLLAMFLLKAHNPEKYSDKVKHEHSGGMTLTFNLAMVGGDPPALNQPA